MARPGADRPVFPAGAPRRLTTPPATLLTALDKHVFKSVRDGADRLNSSPLELRLRLCASLAADPPEVHVEILYSDGQVPVCYVEAAGGMRPVDNPGSTNSCDGDALTVRVERNNFPLSSSHCGRPFLLALVLNRAHVLTTTPFFVMAKAPKSGTTLKPRTPKVPKAPTAVRESVIAAIRMSRAAGPASGMCVLSVGGEEAVGSAPPPPPPPATTTLPPQRGMKHATPGVVEEPPTAKRPRRRCRGATEPPPPPSPPSPPCESPRLPSPYMGIGIPSSPSMWTPTMGGLLAPAGSLPPALALPTPALTAELLKDFGTLSPLADLLSSSDSDDTQSWGEASPTSPGVVLPTVLPHPASTTVLSTLS